MSHVYVRTALAALLAGAAALSSVTARAAWSTDPSNDLVVGQHTTSYQTSPHMVATPDGGFYISWLDAGAGFSIRLQRLDASGNAQWGQNGILVYARTEQYVYDYGLDIDTAGNALLAFDAGQAAPNQTLPGGQMRASKIDANGNFLWGASGVAISPNGENDYIAKIAGTSDGLAAVAWFNAGGQSVLQKLDANGAPLWASPPTFSDNNGAYIADIHGADNGNVIFSYRAASAGALLTQKLASADGSPLWGAAPLVLSDGQSSTGSLSLGAAPGFVPDGAGGAVYSWYVVKGVASATSRVQHVNAAGQRLFADNGFNGVDVSTNNSVDGSGTHVQTAPSLAYDAATHDVYVVYQEFYQDSNAFAATYAQRIDASGVRQWSDTGLPLEAFLTNGQTAASAANAPGGFIAAWSSGTPSTPQAKIHATRINRDASFAWSSVTPVDIKTSSQSTGRLAGANSTQGFAAFVWVDNDSTPNGDVRAQNVRYDGLLGNQSGAAPGAPLLSAASDSGDSNSDGVTNVAQPLFAGACNASGDSITLVVDGVNAGATTCAGNAYAIAPAGVLADGVHVVKAFELNSGGSSPFSSSSSVTIDTTAPSITLSSTPTNPSSASNATFAFTLGEVRPTLCQLDGGGFSACSTPVTYAGLGVGAHTFVVQATDVAGNTGMTTYSWTIQPDAVTVNLDPSTDSGRSDSDHVTNANPLLFNGSCTDGDTIKVFAATTTLGTTTCSGGTFSVSVSTLTTDGNKSISASATRGGVSGPSGAPLAITIDRHAPAAPTISAPATAGPSATVSGNAEINSIVAVSDAGNVVCTALTDGTGSWQCNAAFNGAGTHALTATAADVAGNTSAASQPFDIIVDLSDLVFRNGFEN